MCEGIEINKFQRSRGWLEKFKRRHGIVAKVTSGEHKCVDDYDSENWIMQILSKILRLKARKYL